MATGFVLAAGFGTRMGPLTAEIPKPMLPFAGAPLAAHALFFLKQLGLQRAVLNLHYHPDQIVEGLRTTRGMQLAYSMEEKILGTAGGIRQALDLIDSDCIVIVNPDVILWPRATLSLERLEERLGEAAALLLVAQRQGTETGLRLLDDGSLRFDPDGPDYYIGCALMRVAAFRQLQRGEFAELGSLWRSLDQQRSLRGFRFDGEILDMGSQEAYLRNRAQQIPARLSSAWANFREGELS